MGDLLSRYWHSVVTTGELHEHPVKSVKLSSETLRLFKDGQQNLGLWPSSEEYGPVGTDYPREARLRTAERSSPVTDEVDALLVAGPKAAVSGS